MEECHFVKDNRLYHCFYRRHGRGVYKIPGTEEECHCPDRETDRDALRKIAQKAEKGERNAD